MRSRMILPLSPRLLLALATVLFAPGAFAGTVYQWKDAKGVTHYADAPPPGQQTIKGRELKDGPAPAQAAKPAEAANCVTARANLAQLKSDRPVGLDADGDGKLDKEMSTDERTQQAQQTARMLQTYCDKPDAAP